MSLREGKRLSEETYLPRNGLHLPWRGNLSERGRVLAAPRALRPYLPLLADLVVAQAQRLALRAFETLVHRFHDWRQAEQPDLDIGIFVGPSFDYDMETLKGVARLHERRGSKFRFVNLGWVAHPAR